MSNNNTDSDGLFILPELNMNEVDLDKIDEEFAKHRVEIDRVNADLDNISMRLNEVEIELRKINMSNTIQISLSE